MKKSQNKPFHITFSIIIIFSCMLYFSYYLPAKTPFLFSQNENNFESNYSFRGRSQTVTVKNISFIMKEIPAGSFTMGSPTNEVPRGGGEVPHRVTFTAGFWMMETEVTQELWIAVMGNTSFSNSGLKKPADSANWFEATNFASVMSKTTGKIFLLPSEAQWEYACRGGSFRADNFFCRSAARSMGKPSEHRMGVRLISPITEFSGN